jgi:toxin ParE1/3/4
MWTEARWGVEQAEAYMRGLQAALDLLLTAPEMAPERREILPPVRLYRYRSHVVIYRLAEATLVVHRVVHGRSNWKEAISD